MMKKLPFLFAFVVLVKFSVAQCVPDVNLTGGFTPTVLPDAMVGVAYSQVIQFKIPTDTSYTYLNTLYTGTVSSATFNGVTGLPSGFTVSCNKAPNACSYVGADNGCVSISGTATAGMEGSIPMTLNLKISGVIQPGNVPMVNYALDLPVTFKVVASNGLSVVKAPFFAVSQREDNLVILNSANGKLSVEIYDMLGREVKSAVFQSFKGESSSMNISTLEKGIYFLNLQLNGKQETIKISKGFY
jgi:hypothetical protein